MLKCHGICKSLSTFFSVQAAYCGESATLARNMVTSPGVVMVGVMDKNDARMVLYYRTPPVHPRPLNFSGTALLVEVTALRRREYTSKP